MLKPRKECLSIVGGSQTNMCSPKTIALPPTKEMKTAEYIVEEANAISSRKRDVSFPAKLSALIEISLYLACLSILILLCELNWLTMKHAGLCVLALLLELLLLSWIRLGGGKHPCFLFLCVLPLFQAGRLIAFAMGSPIDPYQVEFLALHPFGISQNSEIIFLLSLSLSAICIYIPCRWNYQPILGNYKVLPRRLLKYIYTIFWVTLPFTCLVNILYFRYASAHGGYLALYTQRLDMLASVPLPIRAISDFMPPAFLAIFVLESRKARLYTSTALYFSSSTIFLLIGSRGGMLTTILGLWCVSGMKARAKTGSRGKHPQLVQLVTLGTLLVLVAASVGSFRNSDSDSTPFTISSFIAGQGTTMSVTELAIQYRNRFSPYTSNYFLTEIESAFMARDQRGYNRGQSLGDDATVFVNPDAYDLGVGIGGSYLGEAYVAGAVPGVVLVSLLLGFGLNKLYFSCVSYFGLFINSVVLPPIFWITRAGIFDWLPVLLRNILLALVLFIGWKIYMQFIITFTAKKKYS